MAITHFEITELPNPNIVVSELNTFPITLGTLYPIAQQGGLSFVRHPDLSSFSVKTGAKFRMHNQPDSIIGNETLLSLFWTPDNGALLPLSSNVNQTIFNNDVIRMIDSLPLNAATEYIIIENLDGVQNLKSKGSAVYKTQKILTQDLVDTKFTANNEGGGDPYFSLDYQVGKGEDINPTVFSIKFKIESLAKIEISDETLINYTDEFDVLGVPTEYNVKEQSFFLLIDAGYQNSLADVEIIINSPFLSLNTWNSVIIDNNGEEIQKFANETFNINVDLDIEGKAVLLVKNNIVEDTGVAKTGQIDVTVLSINGNAALVDLVNDTVQLNTNY